MTRAPTPVSAATRRVPCPLCGAKPGARCRTVRDRGGILGRPVSTEHASRYGAAVAAGHLPLRSGNA